MSEIRLLDYAFQHPTPAAIKAAGACGVMRYLSHSGPPKNLTTAEATALHQAGLSIGLVYESTANRAGKGSQAGCQDATFAYDQAHDLGVPGGTVIFFAVDFDTTADAVTPYFKGVASVPTAYLPGVYGSLQVVDGLMSCGIVQWGWQTVAWSGGKLSDRAHLYQRNHSAQPVPGTDENVLLHPFPLWLPAGARPQVGTPTHAPLPLQRAARMDLYQTKAAPEVWQAVGSHLEHISHDAFVARNLDWADVQVIPADHPILKLPKSTP